MTKFDHIGVARAIKKEFGISFISFREGIKFFKDGQNQGLIRSISGGKRHFRTISVDFTSNEVVRYAQKLYETQKKEIDKHVEGVNITLSLDGETISEKILL